MCKDKENKIKTEKKEKKINCVWDFFGRISLLKAQSSIDYVIRNWN